jgi:methionyl-tRNA formyltransferase
MMDVGLDTGDMLLKCEYAIRDEDDFETVHDALAELGADALAETVKMAEAGTLKGEAQDDSLSTYAEKITKEEGHLDFTLDALTLHHRIRGMSPFPLSYCYLSDGSILKIIKAKISDKKSGNAAAGEVVSLDGGAITVACGNGALDILAVLPQGKGRMPSRDYVNGRKIKVGDILA